LSGGFERKHDTLDSGASLYEVTHFTTVLSPLFNRSVIIYWSLGDFLWLWKLSFEDNIKHCMFANCVQNSWIFAVNRYISFDMCYLLFVHLT